MPFDYPVESSYAAGASGITASGFFVGYTQGAGYNYGEEGYRDYNGGLLWNPNGGWATVEWGYVLNDMDFFLGLYVESGHTFYPRDVNSNGVIVGTGENFDSDQFGAALMTNGSPAFLPNFGPNGSAVQTGGGAASINNLDPPVVLGLGGDATFWYDIVMWIKTASGWTVKHLGPWDEDSDARLELPAYPLKINDRCEILGQLYDGTDFLWQNEQIVDLASRTSGEYSGFQPCALNNSGVMLAWATKNSDGTDAAVLLLPVELIWEAQTGFENVDDNKKVTAVDANDSPTTRQWMQGKGSRIFPDKQNPTDQTANRNRCVLHIKTAPNVTQNNQVFLKTFDVDDATPDAVDNDAAHKLDPNGRAGDDNMDTVWTRTGKFVSANAATATVTLDSNGEAKVIFETTVQPGDNFRVALAFNQEDLNALQVSNPNGNGFVDGDSDKQPKGFNGVVSPMLTVWRHLWCEFDSMGAPPTTGNQKNFDEGTVYSILSSNQIKVSQLSDDTNRFENGWIDIDGVGGFNVVGNSKAVGYDIVTIRGSIGTEAQQHHFTIYDDDYFPIGSRQPRTLPYQLSGGILIYTAFADAFIEPIKVPSRYVQNNVNFEKF